MDKFIPCRACKDKSDIKGYVLTKQGEYDILIECECHKDWRLKKELIYKAEQSNIWSSTAALDYSIDKYQGDISRNNVLKLHKYVDRFEKEEVKSAVIYLWGPNGTQKTTLAHWIGLSLLKKKFSVRYITMQTLVTLLHEFEEREEKDIEVENLKNIDCLIIDEAFNKDKVTLYKSGFQLPYIEIFLKDRVENNKKGIIFVSNTNPVDIMKHGYSESIQNFVIRNSIETKTDLKMEDEYYKNIYKIDYTSIFD